MNKNKYVLVTGTSRSGGKLISNIFSLNPTCLSLSEYIYYFRHIHKKYKNLNNKNLFILSGDFCLRSKYRSEIILDHKKLFNYLKSKNIKKYSDLYKHLFNYLKLTFNIKSVVNIEGQSNEWRHIEKYLQMNKNFKAIQYIRDPRAVLSSFKKITFSKNYGYFNCIFQWLDSFNYHKYLSKKFDKKRYLMLQFENIHQSPKSECKKILNFVNLKYHSIYFKKKNWKKKLNSKISYANISSYDMKPKYGFDKKRINQWKKHLDDWEIETVNYLCAKGLLFFGYEKKLKFNMKKVNFGLKKIRDNNFLKINLNSYVKKNKIKKIFPNDPSNPKNWGSNKTYVSKFIYDSDYKKFVKDTKTIRKYQFI
tara:strand:+ start:7252 stop:8346 length:1095 start_codon:yes stop_codon:yes gene_type:complete